MPVWQVTFRHVDGGDVTFHVEADDREAAELEAWRVMHAPLLHRLVRVAACEPTDGQQPKDSVIGWCAVPSEDRDVSNPAATNPEEAD